MLKFYLHKILQLKKSIEAVGYLIIPSYECFSYAQEKRIENKMEELGVLKLLKQGTGKYIDDDKREKNLFTVDWNQLDCQYRGWLENVPFVDLVKEFNAKPIRRSGSKKPLLKDEDLVINPHINKRIPEGLSRDDLRDCLNAKYPLKKEIDEMLKEINPHLVVENRGEFNLEIEKDTLVKVSYRVTNSLTNLKKADGSRDAFLKRNGLKKQKNGDIKSEIPRVTRLVNTGEWLPFSFDFYAHYLGKEKLRGDVREFVKAQNMPIYFTNWKSPEAFSNRQLHSILINEKHQYDDWTDMVKANEEKTRILLKRIKEGFDKVTGKSYNSLIFLYTSWIETKALQILIKRFPNAKFFQIYDEIFCTEDCGDLEPVYKEAAILFFGSLSNFTGVESPLFSLRSMYEEEIREIEEDIRINRDIKEDIKIKRDIKVVNEVNSSIKKVSLVSKLTGLNSSSSPVKFKSGYMNNKNAAGHHWKLSEETKSKMRQSKSEETKAKMRQPKSEETKAKMRQSKSEETKAKIKSARNKEFQKMVEFAIQVKQSESYIALQKIREKQQFIDKAIQDEFGTLSNVTLTKIRKAIK